MITITWIVPYCFIEFTLFLQRDKKRAWVKNHRDHFFTPNEFLSLNLNTEHSCSLLYIIYMDTALSKSKIIVFTHNSSSIEELFLQLKYFFQIYFKFTSCKTLLSIYSYIDELLILWKCFRLNKRSRTLKQRSLKMLSTGFAKRVVLWCTRSVSRYNYLPQLPYSHPFQYSFAFYLKRDANMTQIFESNQVFNLYLIENSFLMCNNINLKISEWFGTCHWTPKWAARTRRFGWTCRKRF